MNLRVHRSLSWLPHFAGVTAFVTIIFIALVVHDTMFVNGEDYIRIEEGGAVGWNTDSGLLVLYERAFTVSEAADGLDGEIQRVVRCPPDGTDQYLFDGPVTRRNFKAGYYPAVKRPVVFGVKVPVGTKCSLEIWASWRPRFAISSTRWMLDSREFIVQEKP